MAQVKEIKAAQTANKAAATTTAKVLGTGAQGLYDRINAALEQELSTATENSRFDGMTDEEIAALKETERVESIERMQAEAAAKLTPPGVDAPGVDAPSVDAPEPEVPVTE